MCKEMHAILTLHIEKFHFINVKKAKNLNKSTLQTICDQQIQWSAPGSSERGTGTNFKIWSSEIHFVRFITVADFIEIKNKQPKSR